MQQGISYGDPISPWVFTHFRNLQFGDGRLSSRAMKIAERMARASGETTPKQHKEWKDIKGAYRFFSNPKVNPETIQATHHEFTRSLMDKTGVSLLIEDTSEFSWSGNDPVPGLGPIGSGGKGQQGFHLHSVLAMEWPEKIEIGNDARRPPLNTLGVAHQEFYIRAPRPAGEKNARCRKLRSRESQLWTRASYHLGKAPPGVRWVRIVDRGADSYDFLSSCLKYGHGYVVRVCTERCLVDSETGKKSNIKLFEAAKQAPKLGEFELVLRARRKISSRIARLQVSAVKVLIRSPQRPGHAAGYDPPIPTTIVRVHEVNPPPDVDEPIEWVLYCDGEISTFEDALERALQYSCRWIIEEYHKAIKTGMAAKKLQLKTAHSLFSAISFMAVIALRLLDFRDALRFKPDAPASLSKLSDLELKILAAKTGKMPTTVSEVALALGRLGGHINRKSDGMPGWITLWRGMHDLQLLVEGVRMASRFQDDSTPPGA